MRNHPILLIIIFLLFPVISFSQKDSSFVLKLRGGNVIPQKNITQESVKNVNKRLQKVNGKSFAILQFDKIPTAQHREDLTAAGIELMEYIPDGSYSVSFSKEIDYSLLQKVGARAIIELTPEQKIHPAMAKGIFPPWATKTPGMIDVWVSFPKTISFEEIKKLLQEKNIRITNSDYKDYHVIGLQIGIQQITEIASLPFIEYVEAAPHGDQTLNLESRSISRVNILNASPGLGGANLKGEGVVIGVGDNSDPHYHLDFAERIINRAATAHNYHGTHVTGTLAAGGIRMEEYRGYAPKSVVVSQLNSGIISNAPAYFADHKMVLTNNSYGDVVGDCQYMGFYDLKSRIIDLQLNNFTSLQHVFASGNDGRLSCLPYPSNFRTVLSGFQSSKNVLTIGSVKKDKTVSPFSSRGPVKDGRIKPEIMATGSSVISTVPWQIHGNSNGTSMAAPAVTGGAALLYQYYRQQNSGIDPKAGLIKALLCNGADDLGNTGPDFTYGFGNMNLLRTYDMLRNNRYIISSVNHGANNTHNILVPASTAQLKVMLYWNDPASAVFAANTLVNDLDLEVTTPASSTLLPMILDTLPANVNNPATTGVDRINNIEQVVINNPATGSYIIKVKGSSVLQNPLQEYFVVYDFVPVSTKLTYPIGGEAMNPGETILIEWDSYGGTANTFTLEYSLNNGGSWTIINSAIASNIRNFNWVVPNGQAEQALIRLTKNSASQISTSLPFVILGIPTVTVSSIQCQGYFSFDWNTIPGATDYEVFKLYAGEMVSLGTTTLTSYTLTGLARDSFYWVSVRARINGQPGRRAIAQTRQPNNGTCTGAISNNDLLLDSIIAPLSGRLLTSTALTSATSIIARIKNLDDASVTSFRMRYSLNGGVSWVEETVNTTVPGAASYTHTFSTTANLAAIGTFEIRVEVINLSAADPVSANNLIIRNIKQLPNSALNLTTTFLDDFEAADNMEYINPFIGLEGINRYDFSNTQSWGRARTFVNTGIAYSGSRAITLDYDGNYSSGVRNYLTGTYNLSSYNASTNDLRLDFRYKNHGQLFYPANPFNKVWIRGNDTQPWIEVYDLFANQEIPGIFKKSESIEISDSLFFKSQNSSTSFQIRWGQFGHILTADNDEGNGYTFDDIRIYLAINDIKLISIDTPIVNNCGLGNAVPVKVTVRNTSPSAIGNIPVRLIIDGGTPVIETIPGPIAPNTNIQYTFTATANLSSLGAHTVLVNVQYPTDNFRENDTARISVTNSPVINSFPHLENFENGAGNWYSSGTNNSWAFGTPGSLKINKAASGSKAWKTRLIGNHNDNELSYLYSPCYNISGMTNPTLSFMAALDLEDCGTTFCDGVYVEYSQNGKTWSRLGTASTGTNWYNKNYGGSPLWSINNYTRWHVVTTALPTGISNLRLRIVVNSDPYVNFEGVAVDDIHIYDKSKQIYDGITTGTPINQNITGGTSWIDFTEPVSGKLVASIQPNGQNLGSTNVQAFINSSAVRYDGSQYYHNRNLTIKPTNKTLADSAIVRFYFLDSETDTLIRATGCSGCFKPAMVTELGVTKYSDPDNSYENGSLTDNTSGNYSFLSAGWNKKIPFDNGYYIEFKVKDFSEFWLNNGGLNLSSPLPVKILTFTAKKKDEKDALLEWKISAEQNVSRYEIEVAKGTENLQQQLFIKLGEVQSQGNTSSDRNYEFTDTEINKSGNRYYRLKIINLDGKFDYTQVKPLTFISGEKWKLYPNPSNGIFNFIFQLNNGETIKANILDATGKQVHKINVTGIGALQKVVIDLSSPKFPSGVYLLNTMDGEKIRSLRLIKY